MITTSSPDIILATIIFIYYIPAIIRAIFSCFKSVFNFIMKFSCVRIEKESFDDIV